MKKLGLATALLLTLAFGAGEVFAQNTNGSTTGGASAGGTMSSKHSRRHHRRGRRRHRRAKAANANANT